MMPSEPYVVYYSKTGNTKKVAEEIAKVLSVEAMGVRALQQLKGFSPSGLLVVGSGTYANKMGKGMLNFLKDLPSMKSKHAAIFGTSGDGRFEQSGGLKEMRRMLKEKGAKVVGTFCCQGKSFFFLKRGHPSEEELENARKFASSLRKFSK
jgi:flavodoxin